jgi:hypothetical protein
MMKPKLKVGDVVWFVPRQKYNGAPRELTVTKVGRKWATIGEGWRRMRADVGSWAVDGGNYSGPGDLYTSEAAWREESEISAQWDLLRRWIERRYQRPEHLTAAQIADVFAVLRGDEP